MEEGGCKKNIPPEKTTEKNEPPSVTSTPRKKGGSAKTEKEEPPSVELTSESSYGFALKNNVQIGILVLVAVGIYSFW
jgi:hypothetical protein